jgi:N utilization substance protein A
MSIVKSEFALALNQVATERGISPEDVLNSIESAILAAYKKEEAIPDEELDTSIKVRINRDTGEAKILKETKDITPPGFGRIAAQTAKQVILQKIREVEKSTVISQYQSQIGSIVKGRVIRYDNYNAYVDIGKIEAVLPKEEQIRQEKYDVNVTLVFYLKEISNDKYGNSRVVVSRVAPELVADLFKREVPEIGNNTVVVKKVVREPGERAKIAVHSNQAGVDPVGACVGQKGVRVHTVTAELGGEEKIDIIQWNKDDKLFIIAALSPAKIAEVKLDEKEKKAIVTVEEDQTPLAIGRNGINVNLASKLTGYEIDIVQKPGTAKKEAPVVETSADAEVKTEVKEEKEAEVPTEEVKVEPKKEQTEAPKV